MNIKGGFLGTFELHKWLSWNTFQGILIDKISHCKSVNFTISLQVEKSRHCSLSFLFETANMHLLVG